MQNKRGWLYFGFFMVGGMLLSGFLGVGLGLSLSQWGAFLGVTLVSVLFALPVVRSLRAILTTLSRYENGLPVSALPENRLDPLGGLARRVNHLTKAAQQAAGLREQWLSQADRQAAQEERNRLARDLHDSIKQQLFSIQMSAAAARERFNVDAGGALAALEDVQRSSHEALVEMNALLQQLSPAPLERVGLAQALRDQCEALGYRSGAVVECEIGELPGEDFLPPGAQEAFFRVAQEALSNIARHARAKHVRLELREDGEAGEIALTVRDDGQGFDAQAAPAGSGLAGMRARAAALEGSVVVESTPGLGTRLTMRAPVQAAVDETEAAKLPPINGRIALTGLLGGAAISAMLIQPWGQVHNGQIGEIWTPEGFAWSVALRMMALIFLPVVGWLAGRWTKARARGGAALSGAAAGAVAGLTVFGLIGATFAGRQGAMPLLLHGLVPASQGAQMTGLIIASTNNTFLMVFSIAWLLLLAGVGLGLLGGLVSFRAGGPGLDFRRYSAALRMTATALAGGGSIALFVTAMLLPILEASIRDEIDGGALVGLSLPHQAGVVLAFLTPAAFMFSGLALSRRLLGEEIHRAEARQRPQLLREAYQLANLTLWVTVAMALWMGSSWLKPLSEAQSFPVVSTWMLGLITGIGMGLSVWIGRLALHLRGLLIEVGQPHPTDSEAVAMFLLPFFPLLGLMSIWYGAWIAGVSLAVLAVVAGLAFYTRATHPRKKSSPRQYWAGQATLFNAAWPGVALGLAAPLAPTLAVGAALLSLTVRMTPYLDSLNQAEGLTISRMLSDYAQNQPISFVSLLAFCAVVTGGLGLLSYLRLWMSRKSV